MQSVADSLDLLVRQIRLEAEGVLSIEFECLDTGELPRWEPGAHIDLILPNGLIRPYSLCGDFSECSPWKIAVLKEVNSEGGSAYIHDVLRSGDRLRARGPRNQFPLVRAEHYLFIAGGIGITPILSMVIQLEEGRSDWHLLYGGRQRASMAFLETLDRFGERVTVSPEDEFGLLDLRSAIEGTPTTTEVYCCGPEALIAAVEAQCSASSRPRPHIERFKSGIVAERDETLDFTFDVILSSSGRRFTIPPGHTIIEVLQEQDVFVPNSCTEGYCGVCETEVISGIPDHRDELPEELRSVHQMRICVSRSQSMELVLKL